MKVMIKRVGEAAYLKDIEHELSVLQDIVGGLIECISITDDIDMVCNEEGKLIGLEPHLWFNGDIICGDVFFVGVKGADFVSLTDEQIDYLKSLLIE